jgi:hypothetical protein
MQTSDQINPQPETPPAACEMCGRPDALLVGGRWICDDCYQIAGSCCAESDDDCK